MNIFSPYQDIQNHQLDKMIQKTCRDLFEISSLTHFSYYREKKNSSKLWLCSNLDWMKYLCNTLTYPITSLHLPVETIRYEGICYSAKYFWDSITYYIEDENEKKLYGLHLQKIKKNFGIDHGISIIKVNQNVFEYYDFATDVFNIKIKDFYLNHIECLDKFCHIFQEKTRNLIEISEEKPFPFCFFLSKIDFDRLLINYNKNNKSPFTEREYDCLNLAIIGKTAKESAKIMKISPRTVEAHLQKMLRKLGFSRKSQLITYYYDQIKFNHSIAKIT